MGIDQVRRRAISCRSPRCRTATAWPIGLGSVLDHCEGEGIAFLPWFPLGAGRLAEAGGALVEIARRHQATPAQIALAWLLQRSPVMLPIPGTSSVAHLRENLATRRFG